MISPTPFTNSLRYVTGSLYRSLAPLLSTIIAPLLLINVPQGRELLNVVTDDQILEVWQHPTSLLHYVLFLLALLAWGFANWYGSRVLLQFNFDNPATKPGHDFIALWNKWLPRAQGVLGMALIALYLLFSKHQWLAGGIAAAVVVLFALFIINRRRIFSIDAKAGSDSRVELLKGDRIAIWLALSASLVMLLALTTANYSFARTLGSPVILFMALACIVLTASVVLAYLPLSYGWPNLSWIPFILAAVLGGTPLTHNHGVAARVMASGDHYSVPRRSVVEDFRTWTKSRSVGKADWPIFLVAAEGGASRSAWWTAHALSMLDYVTDGEFSRHVYAISSVSGGSLGAATYVGLLAERGDVKPAFSKPLAFPTQQQCWDMRENRDAYPTPMQAECFLGEDFLSTTLGYLLYPDLIQRIFPAPMPRWDRSLGLEQTWQNDWAHLFRKPRPPGGPPQPVGRFSDTLDALYYPQLGVQGGVGSGSEAVATGQRRDLPLLLLNSTRAQAGRAVLQAPISIESKELDDAFAAGLHTHGLPLAAVVHNSARFPLVSPGGEVETRDGKYWDSLVDGGYFENSGAATLVELLHVLLAAENVEGEPPLQDELRKIRVIVILNDPASSRKKEEPKPIAHEELMTPVAGLYNVRSARAEASKRSLLSLLPASNLTPDERETQVSLGHGMQDVRAIKGHEKDPDPSMSWYLNPASRRAMWAALQGSTTRSDLCSKVVEKLGASCQRYPELDSIPAEGDR